MLRDRDYVRLEKRQLIPEDKGRLVTAFLSSFFKRYVEYDFTADLEEKLDKVSNGDISWKEVLRDFWKQFSADVDDTKDLRVSEVLEALNELLAPHVFPKPADGGDPRQCPSCGTGKLSLKLGKFGAFIGCSNYPECRYTRQLAVPTAKTAAAPNSAPTACASSARIRRPASRDGPDRPVRPLSPARRGDRGEQEAEARQPAEGLGRGDHRPRTGAGAAAPCRARSGFTRKPAR